MTVNMLLNIFQGKKVQKHVAQHKFALVGMNKKQYLCTGFENQLNLFCTLKNQTD